MKSTLHVFTDKGLAEFRSRLLDMRLTNSFRATDDIVADPALVRQVSSIEFEVPKSFTSRRECGVYFCDLFEKCEQDLERHRVDPANSVHLWSWITAMMLPYLTEFDGEKFRLGEEARLVFMPFDHKRFYKHLLAGPFLICKPYRADLDRVDILLYNSVLTPLTVFVDQIAVRKSLLMSAGLMDVVTKMYFDREKQRPKPIKLPAGMPAGSATVKRFGTVLNQLSLVWDVMGMPANEIEKILPAEFRFLLT